MSEQQYQAPRQSTLGVPIAIVLAAALIAGAIIYSDREKSPGVQPPANTESEEITFDPVTADDHIRGNPNAPIVIVEYSDFDCPYCKRFHEETMLRIMDEYGTSGQVAWVYRQFPLEQLHPNAPLLSQASECVAELGGNEAFWTFADLIFGEREINESTNVAMLPQYASQAGVDQEAFDSCLTSQKYADEVVASVQKAFDAGARGTPYSIIIAGEQHAVIDGAQPYAVVRSMIEGALAQLGS